MRNLKHDMSDSMCRKRVYYMYISAQTMHIIKLIFKVVSFFLQKRKHVDKDKFYKEWNQRLVTGNQSKYMTDEYRQLILSSAVAKAATSPRRRRPPGQSDPVSPEKANTAWLKAKALEGIIQADKKATAGL